MRRSLPGEFHTIDDNHPTYAFTLFNYAIFIFDQGRYQEAADFSRQILALRDKTLPESHPAIAAALQTLGRCLDKLGDFKGGGQAIEESLRIRRKYNPAGSWLIASSEAVYRAMVDSAKGS